MKVPEQVKSIFTKQTTNILRNTIVLVVIVQLSILSFATKATNNLKNSEVIDTKVITMENIPKDDKIQIKSVDLIFNVNLPFRNDNVVENIDKFDTININLKNDGIIDRKELPMIENQIKEEVIGIKYKEIKHINEIEGLYKPFKAR